MEVWLKWKGGWNGSVSEMEVCLKWKGGWNGSVAEMEVWLKWKGGWNGSVSEMEGWLKWKGGWNGRVAEMEVWLKWKGSDVSLLDYYTYLSKTLQSIFRSISIGSQIHTRYLLLNNIYTVNHTQGLRWVCRHPTFIIEKELCSTPSPPLPSPPLLFPSSLSVIIINVKVYHDNPQHVQI